MNETPQNLRSKIEETLYKWRKTGVPPRATLHETADGLLKWRKNQNVAGLWKIPPRMLGATMDDGWGHGIQLILKYADVLGIETRFSGLLQSLAQILASCEEFNADYLGLTVLQFDTEADLKILRACLPRDVKIIAGGPVFKIDPDFQDRAGIDFVANDVAGFLRLFLKLAP